MKIFWKCRLFDALEVGFKNKNFSIRELRLIAIVAKKDPPKKFRNVYFQKELSHSFEADLVTLIFADAYLLKAIFKSVFY